MYTPDPTYYPNNWNYCPCCGKKLALGPTWQPNTFGPLPKQDEQPRDLSDLADRLKDLAKNQEKKSK